jgi:hypothetical protein
MLLFVVVGGDIKMVTRASQWLMSSLRIPSDGGGVEFYVVIMMPQSQLCGSGCVWQRACLNRSNGDCECGDH